MMNKVMQTAGLSDRETGPWDVVFSPLSHDAISG